MDEVKPTVAPVVGVARRLRAAEYRRLRRGPGPLSLAWSEGAMHWLGTGEAAAHSGAGAASVLAAVGHAPVEVTGPAVAPPAPWFCGFAFDGGAPTDSWWESFPAARAFLPKFLLAEAPDGMSLTAYQAVGADGVGAARARAEAALQMELQRPAFPPGDVSRAPLLLSVREDGSAWEALLAQALEALQGGLLRKVVLARPLDVVTDTALDVSRAVARAQAASGGAVVFAVRALDGTTFLGASPERLLRVEGRRFWTQALAGSAAPGEGARLAGSPKEVREHAAVVDDVRAALDAVAEQLLVEPSTSLFLPYVTHLETRITGTLRPGVTPAEAALALHPTAAVCGAPRERARGFLRAHERLARGWYAGAVGWLGGDAADLRVALRCALVRGAAARLFIGAGVVEGSTAHGEWVETGRKAQPMLEALLGETRWRP